MIGHRNLSLALAASMIAVAPVAASQSERPRNNRRRLATYATPLTSTTSASINRWTGKPHEHKREIARRLRQVARSGGLA